MIFPKFNKLSFLISLVISVFSVITPVSFIFFFLEPDLFWLIGLSLVGFLLILFFSYSLLSFHINKYLRKRVRELYNSIFTSTTSTSILKTNQDIDLLMRNLKKLNSDKNLQIEDLKNQENFRKEFIGNIAHELKTPLFTIQGFILT